VLSESYAASQPPGRGLRFFAQKARDRGCPGDTERLKPDGGWWTSWFVGATGVRAEMCEEE
jgi:hypothetical protein